jgi:GT2 family glycosyltransferase
MIAVVIASFGREQLLRRLLVSLRACPALNQCRLILVNNGPEKLEPLAVSTGWKCATILKPERNLGCAGGVSLAMEEALRDPKVQKILILDDDSILSPDAPAILAQALDDTGGAMVVPLLTNAVGEVAWYPGLVDPLKWRVIKRPKLTPETYLAECGPTPEPFKWAPWPTLMLTRATLEACGLPMLQLWYQGVDIEYTLRVTANRPGYLVPLASASHQPPVVRMDERYYYRECGGLQNCFFTFICLPHGRRALRHLPGNVYRFIKCWRATPRVIADVMRAFWWGGIRARPQGVVGFDYFRHKWHQASGE